jgi:hypothetical protein
MTQSTRPNFCIYHCTVLRGQQLIGYRASLGRRYVSTAASSTRLCRQLHRAAATENCMPRHRASTDLQSSAAITTCWAKRETAVRAGSIEHAAGKLPNTPVPSSLSRGSPRSSTTRVPWSQESKCTSICTRYIAHAHARNSTARRHATPLHMPLHVSWSHSPRQIFGRLRFVCLVLIIGMLVPRNTRVLDGRDDQRVLASAVMVMMMIVEGKSEKMKDRHTLLQRVDDRGGEHGRLTPPPPSDLICLPRLLISSLPSRICLHNRCTSVFMAMCSLETLDACV